MYNKFRKGFATKKMFCTRSFKAKGLKVRQKYVVCN